MTTAKPDATAVESESCFSSEELEQFERDGLVVARGLANPALVATMRDVATEGLRRAVPPVEYEAELGFPGAPADLDADGGRTIRRLRRALSRHQVFTDWVTTPALVRRLRQLLGPDVVMPLAHHNCVMTKQPEYSSDTGWHQDIRYWAFERHELISVWLALVPEYPDNGGLELIPGSHRESFEPEQYDEALFFVPDRPENQPLLDRRVAISLDPGDVLFFHCRTLHSAGRNRSDETKISAVFTFRPADNPPIAGTRSAAAELLLPRG